MNRTLLRTLSSTLALLLLTSCSSLSSAVKGVINQKPTSLHSLTGLPGEDAPILAVKIDDTNAAHPQIGIDQADVVYVEQVEAGLTRLLAIFSSQIPEKIGPIRSVRISDIDLLAQYGKVGFAYSGAQSKMRPVVAAAHLIDLGAERNPPTIYTRDPNRTSPVDMVLLAPSLLEKALAKHQSDLALSKPMGWTFGKKPVGGKAIEKIVIDWPNATYSATWSASEKRWLLSHNGTADLDSDGKQLGSPTLVIQNLTISPSIYGDKFGGITPLSESVGTGSGYLLRDGEIFPVKWNRPDATSGTTWVLDNGAEKAEPADFAPGQIWFLLTDKSPTITYVAPEAKPSKSK